MADWFESGANVRQMHSTNLPPAGKGVGLESTDDGEYVRTKVVEPTAIRLVDEDVYSGYSVGIARPRIVRDAKARGGRIVGGRIVELSLVDRPANPMAKFQVAKAARGGMAFVGKSVSVPSQLQMAANRLKKIGAHVTVRRDDGSWHEGRVTARTGVGFRLDPRGYSAEADAKFFAYEEVAAVYKGAVPEVAKRDFDPGVGGGVDRDKLPTKDFADPANRKFPIHTPADVSDAWGLAGHAANPDAVRRRIKSIARRKGPEFVAALPATATEKAGNPDAQTHLSGNGGDIVGETAQKAAGVTHSHPHPGPGGVEHDHVHTHAPNHGDHSQSHQHSHTEDSVADAKPVAEAEVTKGASCEKCGAAAVGDDGKCNKCGFMNKGEAAAEVEKSGGDATPATEPTTADKATEAPAAVTDGADADGDDDGDEDAASGDAAATAAPADAPAAPPTKKGKKGKKGAKAARSDAAKAEKAAVANATKDVSWLLRRAHDFTCGAYKSADVREAYPSVEEGVEAIIGKPVQKALWKQVQKAFGAGDQDAVLALSKALAATRELLGVEPGTPEEMFAAREELHAAFKAVNDVVDEGTGKALPKPTEAGLTPGQFKRPYISDGHQREVASASPAHIPTATHPISAEDYTRGALTEGHQRYSANKLAALHDGLADWRPELCRMDATGNFGATRQPITPAVGKIPNSQAAGPVVRALPQTAAAPGEKADDIDLNKLVQDALEAALPGAVQPYINKITSLEAQINELGSAPDTSRSASRGVTDQRAAQKVAKQAKVAKPHRTKGEGRKAEKVAFYRSLVEAGTNEQRIAATERLAKMGIAI